MLPSAGSNVELFLLTFRRAHIITHEITKNELQTHINQSKHDVVYFEYTVKYLQIDDGTSLKICKRW